MELGCEHSRPGGLTQAMQVEQKLRIEFLTQDDPLYILPFFAEFFRHYAAEYEITGVDCSPVMGKRSRQQLLKELYWLYGAVGLLRLLGRSVGARVFGVLPRTRGAKRFHSLTQLCGAYGVPLRHIGDPNESAFVSQIEARAPQVIVSVACPYILKAKLLQIPRAGCVNIHHAPLPRYKGMMPTFWQMYHGEKTLGVTVHYMAAKLDEGPVLLQAQVDVEPDLSLDRLIQLSKKQGAHCMATVLRQIQAGEQRPVMLDNSTGSYFTFPTRKEICEFRRRGLRAI